MTRRTANIHEKLKEAQKGWTGYLPKFTFICGECGFRTPVEYGVFGKKNGMADEQQFYCTPCAKSLLKSCKLVRR